MIPNYQFQWLGPYTVGYHKSLVANYVIQPSVLLTIVDSFEHIKGYDRDSDSLDLLSISLSSFTFYNKTGDGNGRVIVINI